MNRLGIIVAILFIFAAGFALLVVQVKRSHDSHVLLNQLRAGSGDMADLKMRLQLARGDLITPMIEAASDLTAPDTFRCDVIEMLSQQYQRLKDEEVAAFMLRCGTEPNPVIRRAVMKGISIYGDNQLRLTMLDQIDDPDEQVRRQIYSVFTARGWNSGENSMWEVLTGDQKKTLVAAGLKAMKSEQNADLEYLARSIVGLKIEELCNRAIRARKTGQLDLAESLLTEALALDSGSHRAQATLTRHYLAIDDREKALATGRKYGAVLTIPRLASVPVIDGDPMDIAWEQSFRSDRFYHTSAHFASRRVDGRTRFYIGHDGIRIYIAVIGWEDDLTRLHISHTTRDSDVWLDDCVEIFFLPDITSTKHYQFVINAANTILDHYDRDWSANFHFDSATSIFNDRGYWCCEFAIKASELTEAGITPQSIWGFNLARVRIGLASEHGQWWPTYGRANIPDRFPVAVFEAE